MNKKQKATVVCWCVTTAWAGYFVASFDITPADFKMAVRHVALVWGTATLILAALFWMFSEKNWEKGSKP
jgi:hypothetical protein